MLMSQLLAPTLREVPADAEIVSNITSTIFRPEFEGRIASEVETPVLPDTWQNLLST